MKQEDENIHIKLVKGIPKPDIPASIFDSAIKSANNPKHLRKILMALRKK